MRDYLPAYRAHTNMEQRVIEYLTNYMNQLPSNKYIVYFTIPLLNDVSRSKTLRIHTDSFVGHLPSTHSVFPRNMATTPEGTEFFSQRISRTKNEFERLAERNRLVLDKLDYGTLRFQNDQLDLFPKDAEIPQDELISHFIFAKFEVPSLKQLITRNHIKLNKSNLKRLQKNDYPDHFLESVFPEDVVEAVKVQKRSEQL